MSTEFTGSSETTGQTNMNKLPQTHAKDSLYELTRFELSKQFKAWGQPAFRADQIWQWVYNKGCRDFWRMSNIRKDLRSFLDQTYSLELPPLSVLTSSEDQTVKGLLELWDAEQVEWVLIPDKDHFTLCLSTQVGCSLACSFCSTGRMGFVRNLSAGEIVAQVLVARQILAEQDSAWPLRNIVFMGMGEPLLNWPEVEKSLHIIRDSLGLGFSHRRVTISTVGLPRLLETFAHTQLASLAISLHAPTQKLRQQIMPRAAGMLPLPDLVQRLQNLPLKPRQRITIEYLLLGGVNDGLAQARDLNRLLSCLKCKINLISFNPAPGLPYQAPGKDNVLAFQQFLQNKGQTVTLRKSKGQDIQAACGQLRNTLSRDGSKHFPLVDDKGRRDHAQT